jgi:hypothetical protein
MNIQTRQVIAFAIACMLLAVAAAPARAHTSPDTRCLLASGKAATKCVKSYAAAVGACRNKADAACEAALRGDGTLDGLLVATEKPTRQACSAEGADKLSFSLGIDDLVFHTAQACEMWGGGFRRGRLHGQPRRARPRPGARASSPGAGRARHGRAGVRSEVLRARVRGQDLHRQRRDTDVAGALAMAGARIEKRRGVRSAQTGCGATPRSGSPRC